VCRAEREKRNQPPQCEINKICGRTHNYIDDENEPMLLYPQCREIIYLWELITNISKREKFTQYAEMGNRVLTLPTLDKIDIVLNNINWKTMLNTKQDSVYYLSLFHSVYIATIRDPDG